jgi:hypothetical protein
MVFLYFRENRGILSCNHTIIMKNDKDNLTQKEWEIENSNLTEEELKRN